MLSCHFHVAAYHVYSPDAFIGPACSSVTDAVTMTMVGTPFYVAPEVVKGDHYTTSADMYSYGMTLLCFAIRGSDKLGAYLKKAYARSTKAGADPGKPISDNRVAHMMVNKDWRPTSHVKELGLPETVASLLEICWLSDPSERPTFKEILDSFLQTFLSQPFPQLSTVHESLRASVPFQSVAGTK